MKVVTAAQMRDIDKKAIGGCGIPGIVLMENAGINVLRCMEEHFGDLSGKHITIVAGKGNNGGDGFVVARHLKNKGVDPTVIILADKGSIKGDAGTNLKVALNSGIDVKSVPNDKSLNKDIRILLRHSHIIVDAILGTGITDPVKGFFEKVINYINSTNKPIVSVDIPSGLSADKGEIIGTCIKANLTVTLALPKVSLLTYPAASMAGILKVVDISIPDKIIDDSKTNIYTVEGSDVSALLKPRRADAHKGDFGHAFIVAGSPGKTGAATLTSLGALQAGAGLVTLAVPESLNPIIEAKLTEVMSLPVQETKNHTFSKGAIKDILSFSKGKSAVALGPGISTDDETVDMVMDLIKKVDVPLVIDADGVNALSQDIKVLKKVKAPIIITPHPGEMSRLTKSSSAWVQKNRIVVASSFAKEYKVYVVLKGKNTIISAPDGSTFINLTGNPAMASGGSGDVLTGMIVGHISQGLSLLDAAKVSVYLHGLAADVVAYDNNKEVVIATDILDALPNAFSRVKRGSA